MPGDLRIQVNGLDELRAAFRRSPQVVENHLQKAIAASVFTLQKNTLKQDPVPWRTGNLLQSFSPPVVGRLFGRYFPRAAYALKVHEKTTYKDGRPYPYGNYMPKILSKSEQEIDGFFRTTLERIVGDLAA